MKNNSKEDFTTVLCSAYAVNPYNGSEDGMGWNFILQIARKINLSFITLWCILIP